MEKNNLHTGSSFSDFLENEGLEAEVSARAAKRTHLAKKSEFDEMLKGRGNDINLKNILKENISPEDLLKDLVHEN